MVLEIATELLDDILSAAERSPGGEICGLLLGSVPRSGFLPASTVPPAETPSLLPRGGRLDEPGMTVVAAVTPCRNIANDPVIRFEIDPIALLAARRAARSGGPRVIGYYHSHPSGDAVPSPRDAMDAAPDGAIWMIVARGQATAWRAVQGGVLHGRFNPVALRVGAVPVTQA